MRHDAWRLVSGSLSPDKRRARVSCDACGITVDRIYPFRRTVEQVEHEAGTPRSTR